MNFLGKFPADCPSSREKQRAHSWTGAPVGTAHRRLSQAGGRVFLPSLPVKFLKRLLRPLVAAQNPVETRTNHPRGETSSQTHQASRPNSKKKPRISNQLSSGSALPSSIASTRSFRRAISRQEICSSPSLHPCIAFMPCAGGLKS